MRERFFDPCADTYTLSLFSIWAYYLDVILVFAATAAAKIPSAGRTMLYYRLTLAAEAHKLYSVLKHYCAEAHTRPWGERDNRKFLASSNAFALYSIAGTHEHIHSSSALYDGFPLAWAFSIRQRICVQETVTKTHVFESINIILWLVISFSLFYTLSLVTYGREY